MLYRGELLGSLLASDHAVRPVIFYSDLLDLMERSTAQRSRFDISVDLANASAVLEGEKQQAPVSLTREPA